MKKPFNRLAPLLLALSLACAPYAARAGVYDDTAAWWHFDYDPNANNRADLDEIRDQRDWGTATTKGVTGRHATGVQGSLGGPQWTNSTALRPAGGQEYGGRSMLFRPAVDVNTNCWPDTFRVAGLGLAGSATLLMRFRWDGAPTPVEQSCWFYNNHLEWNYYRGWLFGVASSPAKLTLYTQKQTIQSDTVVSNGVWYDVAMVLTDGGETNPTDTVEFYLWKEGGALQYQKKTSTAITNSINPSPTTIIGSEVFGGGYASGNSRKAFSGEVNHLAVWNRALTAAEVNDAFGNPQPLFQIGLNNNSVFDLRPESETDAEYLPGDPWHTMRRAVTDGYREATLSIPLTNYQARLSYAFHVKTTTDGNAAGLSLIVNTTTNETQTAGPNRDLYWYVTTNQLVTGTNTFALRYESGPSAYIGFDWLELGGAWQVGYEDNNQAEFIVEGGAPDDFFVTDPNWMHLERAISSGDTNVNVHFSLSPELVKKYFFAYTTRIIGQGPGGTNHAFSVDFNGVTLGSYPPSPNGTALSFQLDRELVKSTDNVLKVRYDDDPAIGGYLQFDFHRLTVAEAPRGTLIFMR